MPPDLSSFKSVVRRHFPSLFDTRILSCAGPLQGLGTFTGRLSAVVDEMLKVSSIVSHVSFTFDSLVSGGCDATQHLIAHNAGFGALLPGKLFAYVKYALESANVSVKVYENRLAAYTRLISIDLQSCKDSALPAVTTCIFYMTNASGLRAGTIRVTLLAHGITYLVIYRRSGYIIQPVGAANEISNMMETVKRPMSLRAHMEVNLYRVYAMLRCVDRRGTATKRLYCLETTQIRGTR
ncbi:hypothetical protein JKF63_01232 [Porcisia hertigi]|uniref:Uncharacterized protein n=1 Tax=Porcisia hertigi TaxID=2761500 RepID=A0A836L9R1_9TRYP|nr:hypothetical protein JKF63_01232 [Porcisia hertigi]